MNNNQICGIYKITDKITNEIYIGQSIQIAHRFQQHKARSQNLEENTLLYKAMRRDGINNFDFEIIEECPKEKLNEREQYWIQYYHSWIGDPDYTKGLNMQPGGNSYQIYNADDFYQMWDQGMTVTNIAKILNCSPTTVQNYLKGYKDYDAHSSHVRGGKSIEQATGNEIIQYDLKGNFIKEWTSAKEIQRELNINAASIGKVLNGKRLSAGGFQWKRKNDLPKDISKKAYQIRKIGQYSLNDKLIKIFNTIQEAADEMNCDSSNIRYCLKGRNTTNQRQTACGFKWKYID